MLRSSMPFFTNRILWTPLPISPNKETCVGAWTTGAGGTTGGRVVVVAVAAAGGLLCRNKPSGVGVGVGVGCGCGCD